MRGSLKLWQLLAWDDQGKFQELQIDQPEFKASTDWEILR